MLFFLPQVISSLQSGGTELEGLLSDEPLYNERHSKPMIVGESPRVWKRTNSLVIKTAAGNDGEPVDQFHYHGIWLDFLSFLQDGDFILSKLTLK